MGEACPASGPLGGPEETVPENPQASYYRARYYDQSTGRFLSEDPLELESPDVPASLYLYARNNPVTASDAFGLYTLDPHQKIPPLPPSPPLDKLLTCIENCYGQPIVITSTSEFAPDVGHTPNTPHGRGEAADIKYPSNPSKMLCCAAQCGAGFGLDEGKNLSKLGKGAHVHVQLGRGTKGGHGDLPRVKPCTNCGT
jgi:RHS repeat-associated protein